jgi:DNA repair protein RadC
MTKVKDLPKHLRPREKLIEKGPENLENVELLAILLRTGREGKSVLDISKTILKQFPLEKLLCVTIEDLSKIKGIGSDKSATLLAAFELSKRATKSFDQNLPVIDSPQKAVDQLTHIRSKQKEHFVALYLNARNQLIHKETISVGHLTASLVHPREVFAPALAHHAASLILAHNHPSGSLEPSQEDKTITTKLIAASEVLNINIIDHLIVTTNSFISFKEIEIL